MHLGDIQSTFYNFPCNWETLCQLLSTLCAAGLLSVNFHQLSIRQGNLPLTLSTFCTAVRPSVNFSQLFMQPGDLSSTSVNFACSEKTFLVLLSNFRATERPSVNCRLLFRQSGDLLLTTSTIRAAFCQHFVRPWNLQSTSVYFPCSQETFRQLFVQPGNLT